MKAFYKSVAVVEINNDEYNGIILIDLEANLVGIWSNNRSFVYDTITNEVSILKDGDVISNKRLIIGTSFELPEIKYSILPVLIQDNDLFELTEMLKEYNTNDVNDDHLLVYVEYGDYYFLNNIRLPLFTPVKSNGDRYLKSVSIAPYDINEK